MTWETVQPIEVVWSAFVIGGIALLVWLLRRAWRLWREYEPFNGALAFQTRLNVLKFSLLLLGILAALVLVIPALFLEPRSEVDPREWARISSIASPVAIVVMLLCFLALSGLLWWGQHWLDDYFRSQENRDREAAFLAGTSTGKRWKDASADRDSGGPA